MVTLRENHGDRSPSPKSLTELLREAQLMEEADGVPQADPERIEVEEWPMPAPPTAPITMAEETTLRTQAVAIAASSFGGQGCFDDEALARRADFVLAYIRNTL